VVDVKLCERDHRTVQGVYVQLTPSEKQFIPVKSGGSVIFSSGVVQTFESILNNHLPIKENTQYLTAKRYQLKDWGCIVLFVTFKRSDVFPKCNYWIHPNMESEEENQKWLEIEHHDDMECPIKFVSFPSAKDPTYHNPDRFPDTSTCQIISFVPNKWLDEQNIGEYQKDEYVQLKQSIADKLYNGTLEFFAETNEEIYLAMDGGFEDATLGTPKTFDRYINSYYGQMYGIAPYPERFHSKAQSELRPEINGLNNAYFTGQDIMCVGFSSAQQAGLITCSKILGRNLVVEEMSYSAKMKGKYPKFEDKKRQ